MGRRLAAPQGAQHGDGLAQASAALGDGDAGRIEVRLELAADADAEDQAAAAQQVEGRDLLGDRPGMA